MHSHIAYICLTFLHCACSNAPSKRLYEKRQSHIGCICLDFLHCEFSNVSPNFLHQQRQSYINCICLAFLRCEFSNVSSNCETQPPASIGWVALSSLFGRCLSRIGNTSSHLHYMMFQTIQTIYFLWGYDPGNMSMSFIAELSPVYCCLCLLRSYILITLIKYLKGHKSLGSLFLCQN